MSNDEIRIAVAECLGWNWIKGWGWKFKGKGKHTPAWYEGDSKKHCSILPNFPKSLDACAEFENKEAEANGAAWQADYLLRLQEVIERRRRGLSHDQIDYWMTCATPLQRCEAYLRLCGKWKEGKL